MLTVVVVMLESVDLHQGGDCLCHKAHHHNISDATVRAGVHNMLLLLDKTRFDHVVAITNPLAMCTWPRLSLPSLAWPLIN